MSTINPTPAGPSMSSGNQRTIAASTLARDSFPDIHAAIFVTLTPSDDFNDRRTVSLQPGGSLVIGRASTNGGRNLMAATDNALFPRPVVSRTHAELRAHPNRPPHQQVTITDCDSTHGTYVNGMQLQPHHPFALRDGDDIKLGDRVSRGDETHNAVTLHYRRAASLASLFQPTHPLPTQGFQVPSESEDDSDPASDDESVISAEEEEESSAHTTPEQTKMSLGSQEQPIELDKPTEVVYLEDDEDEEDEGEVTFAANNAEPSSVQQSFMNKDVDRDGSVELGEPVVSFVKDTYDSDEDEAENAYNSDEDDFPDRDQESVIGSDGHNSTGQIDDEDMGIDLAPPPSKPQSQGTANESVVKETLFVSPPPARSTATSNAHIFGQDGLSFNSFQHSHSQSAFDPVRGIQRPNPATTSQPRASSSYTYGNINCSLPRKSTTDSHDSSRWDVQPAAVASTQYTFNNSQPFYTAPPPPPDFSYSGPSTRPSGFEWAFPQTAKEPNSASMLPSEFVQPTFGSAPFLNSSWPTNQESERFNNPSFTPRSPRKKISIPDITQRADEERYNFAMPEAPTMAEAAFDFGVQDTTAADSRKATTGGKRKASEMSDIDSDEDDEIEVQDSIDGPQILEKMLERAHAAEANIKDLQPASSKTQELIEDLLANPHKFVQAPPPAKKARVPGALDVAKTVGKYAAVASAGAGGMVAFLASPYAQQMLEWMG